MLQHWKSRHGERGFTLVEIAIVIVIIGLLIGGVLKGRTMIENAKATRLVKQADELRTAVLAFQDKYGYLPGDENKDAIPVGGTDSEGDNDGFIESSEIYDMFLDLQIAGFISGSFDGTSDLPPHPFGNTVRLQWSDAPGDVGAKHFFIFYYVPGEIAQALDLKYDDGDYTTGSYIANTSYDNDRIHLYIQF